MYFTERCIKIKFTYHTVQLFRTFSVQFKIYNSMLGFFLHIYRVVQPLPQTNFRKLSSSPKKTNVYPPKKTNVYLLAVTLHSDPLLCQRLLDIHRQVWFSLLWGHCSFLLGPGAHEVLFVPSKSLFPQSCVSSVIKSHWPPKSNCLGALGPLARSPGWKICCGS